MEAEALAALVDLVDQAGPVPVALALDRVAPALAQVAQAAPAVPDSGLVAFPWALTVLAATASARAHPERTTPTQTTTGATLTVVRGKRFGTTCTSSNSPSWVHKATTISPAKRLGIFLAKAEFCCGLKSGKSSHKK